MSYNPSVGEFGGQRFCQKGRGGDKLLGLPTIARRLKVSEGRKLRPLLETFKTEEGGETFKCLYQLDQYQCTATAPKIGGK